LFLCYDAAHSLAPSHQAATCMTLPRTPSSDLNIVDESDY
jgi:hypothetical protein